jgi:hypothetical protein
MENNIPQKESIGDVLKKYKQMQNNGTLPKTPQQEHLSDSDIDDVVIQQTFQNKSTVVSTHIPSTSNSFNPQDYERAMSRETDPDLITSYEVIKLPSKGIFYKNGLTEVNVEYMTSIDEDILTTPSLIENGTVFEVLMQRKIKTKGVNPNDLLVGDRNAILLFLRSSSYGSDYHVQVPDPRTNIPFKTTINLTKLKYRNITELPDESGCFIVELPMRKKIIKFKLLTYGEEMILQKKSDAIKEAYGQEFSEFNTLKLKSHIISINEKTDRSYINKFVDAMPALDALTIRRKIVEVSPDVDMNYEFTTKDEFKFNAQLSIGIDFFFPNN